jgi:hypothetical protein
MRVMLLQTNGLLAVDCTIEDQVIHAGILICDSRLRAPVGLINPDTNQKYGVVKPEFVGCRYQMELERI